MKIKRFNAENSGGQRHGKPTVNISKNGAISFSRTTMSELKIEPGTMIEFVQDEDSPKDWYLIKDSGDSGFKCRFKADKMLTFNSSYVCKSILKSLGLFKSASFIISKEPTELSLGLSGYAIITKSAHSRS